LAGSVCSEKWNFDKTRVSRVLGPSHSLSFDTNWCQNDEQIPGVLGRQISANEKRDSTPMQRLGLVVRADGGSVLFATKHARMFRKIIPDRFTTAGFRDNFVITN